MHYKWTQYLVWLSLLVPFFSLGQVPARPDPPRLVNDLAGILTPEQVAVLEDSLVNFNNETSNQIAVVTVTTLGGYDPAEFAFRIGDSWGVGQKEKNNGIVVLVKPKTPDEKGQVYISVGYGLEGVIPDALANGRIIDREMIPRFMENDYFGGIMQGTRVIMELSRGEYTAEAYSGEENPGMALATLVFLVILIVLIVLIAGGGKRKSFNTGSRSLPAWILLDMLTRKGQGGSWSDFSGGRGGFGGFGGGGGGFGGGGFGGFGGGGFGGGGAGGSW